MDHTPGYRAEIQTLIDMVKIGMSPRMVIPFMDMTRQVHGLPMLDRDLLAWAGGPIICHNRDVDLGSHHPIKQMRTGVAVERIEIAAGLRPELLVGPCEMACVLFNYQLENCLGDAGGRVFLWAGLEGAKACGALVTGRESSMKPSTEEMLADPPMRQVYQHWSRLIRKKVVEHVKAADQYPSQPKPLSHVMERLKAEFPELIRGDDLIPDGLSQHEVEETA